MIWIDIDIHNSRQMLDVIIYNLSRIKEWNISKNVGTSTDPNPFWNKYPNKTARYFKLVLDTKRFTWESEDNSQVYDNIDIFTLTDVYNLIEFVQDNDKLFSNWTTDTSSENLVNGSTEMFIDYVPSLFD
jgi:hypothetical protein